MSQEKYQLKSDTQKPDETRPIESLSLPDYINLLDRQISSATTPEDIHRIGIVDNTVIDLKSENPRELLEKIAFDMKNPQIFPNYEPLPPEEYKASEDDPPLVFHWNSQLVQLKLFAPYGTPSSHFRFITSANRYPAGFSREAEQLNRDNPEEWDRYGEAMFLAETKEGAMVVNDFLRYCEKNDLHGMLALNFSDTRPESEELSELSF